MKERSEREIHSDNDGRLLKKTTVKERKTGRLSDPFSAVLTITAALSLSRPRCQR